MDKLKIGIVGLDTSHVVAFTNLLNNPGHPFHIPGGQVVAAFPGCSIDFKPSYNRVDKFTATMREKFAVEIMEEPTAVAESCDAILLESVDGRVHLELFQALAPYGKPVFIDKPLAVSYAEAVKIAELAAKHHVPVMSSSALRYAESLQQARDDATLGRLLGADTFGPAEFASVIPGYYWYGIHAIEMLYAILGRGCHTVSTRSNDEHDVIIGEWADGRTGTVRGNRTGNQQFGALLHRAQGSVYVDASNLAKPYYASLLEQVMHMFLTGRPPLPFEETLEVIRFIEAANESRATGKSVTLDI